MIDKVLDCREGIEVLISNKLPNEFIIAKISCSKVIMLNDMGEYIISLEHDNFIERSFGDVFLNQICEIIVRGSDETKFFAKFDKIGVDTRTGNGDKWRCECTIKIMI